MGIQTQPGKNTEAGKVEELAAQLRPLLTGHDRKVQGAALADLLALWLAGHIAADGEKGVKTEKLREKVLKLHLKAVKRLTPINYRLYIEPQLKA